MIALKDMGSLDTCAFNSRQVGLLCNASRTLNPLTRCLFDERCRCHSSLFSYQEEYTYGLFPRHVGFQGEHSLHPQLSTYQHRREYSPIAIMTDEFKASPALLLTFNLTKHRIDSE